jgi:glycosyltransferase involved in cell wall biosynthesis
MAGDGPCRAEWAALAARHRVECTFPGWLSGDERVTWLRRASVVALPSTWPEPFGLVGLEAGSVGVPTVAFDVGGISEWLRHDVNGVLVSGPFTAERFGEALAGVLADGRQLAALRKGARQRAAAMPLSAHLDRLEATFAAVVPMRSAAASC